MHIDALAVRPPARVIAKHIHMLVVGDGLRLVRMLRDSGTGDPFDVTLAPRIVDACSALRQDAYDIVLLDMDGNDMTALAEIHAESPHTPIVALMMGEDPAVRSAALKAGARHCLIKGRESGYSLRFVIEHALG